MKKPMYDLSALIAAIDICDKNIAAFEDGIKAEKKKKSEYKFFIKEHEKYNKYLEGN